MLEEKFRGVEAILERLQASHGQERRRQQQRAFQAMSDFTTEGKRIMDLDTEFRRRAAEQGEATEEGLRRIAAKVGFTEEMRKDHQWYSAHHEEVEATALALEQTLSSGGRQPWN